MEQLVPYVPDLFASSAIAVGLFHTVIGIDHYLPFLVIGRAQGWPLRKVLGLTFLCGLGHVSSSIVIGLIGVGMGLTLQKWHVIHGVQANLASWSLIVFGFTYAAWSIARSRRGHQHLHSHGDGILHAHPPKEERGLMDHDRVKIVTTWSLFIIFVLGPCEPLVPLMIVPALAGSLRIAMRVAAVFSVTTVSAMLLLVTAGYQGFHLVSLNRLQTHANTLAGLAIAATGVAMRLFGI